MSLTKIPIALLADGTDGNIISFDASGNPVAVATGSSGQALTSGGAGAAPAFAAVPAGLNFIGSTTADNDATITVTGLTTTYDMYLIGINDLKIATDAQDIHMRFGDSGGIDSGAADYSWINTALTADADNTGSTSDPKGSEDSSDAFICISGQNNAVGNAATEGFGGMWTLTNAGAGTNLPGVIGNYNNTNQSTGVTIGISGGHRRSKISVTQIQIFAESGNLTSGTLVVWGLSKS
jgi:hypothetical protein